MKWFLAIWIMMVIGLGAVYNNVIDLQEIIKTRDFKIFILQNTVNELTDKSDIWYKNQIEKWVPYEYTREGITGQISSGSTTEQDRRKERWISKSKQLN